MLRVAVLYFQAMARTGEVSRSRGNAREVKAVRTKARTYRTSSERKQSYTTARVSLPRYHCQVHYPHHYPVPVPLTRYPTTVSPRYHCPVPPVPSLCRRRPEGSSFCPLVGKKTSPTLRRSIVGVHGKGPTESYNGGQDPPTDREPPMKTRMRRSGRGGSHVVKRVSRSDI